MESIIFDSSVVGGIYNYKEFHIIIKKDKAGWYAIIEVPEQFKEEGKSNKYVETGRVESLDVCYTANISRIDEYYEGILNDKD